MSQQPSLTAAPTLFLRSTDEKALNKGKENTGSTSCWALWATQALSFLEDTTVLTAKQFSAGLGTKVGQARKLESPAIVSVADTVTRNHHCLRE